MAFMAWRPRISGGKSVAKCWQKYTKMLWDMCFNQRSKEHSRTAPLEWTIMTNKPLSILSYKIDSALLLGILNSFQGRGGGSNPHSQVRAYLNLGKMGVAARSTAWPREGFEKASRRLLEKRSNSRKDTDIDSISSWSKLYGVSFGQHDLKQKEKRLIHKWARPRAKLQLGHPCLGCCILLASPQDIARLRQS